MKAFIFILLIQSFFNLLRAETNIINNFIKVLSKINSFEEINNEYARINKLNIQINNCSTFPYFSYKSHHQGNLTLYNNLKDGLKISYACFNDPRSHHFIKEKYNELLKILLNDKLKTLRCIYGERNSVFAVASVTPGHKKDWINDFFNLPTHPSVLFDTNVIAGNFPLHMTNDDIDEYRQVWNSEGRVGEIKAGIRNPDYTKIKNTKALVFHEIFHWPENFHNQKTSLDIVKLSEFCCFENYLNLKNEKKIACKMLYDKKAWQKDSKKRIKYIKEKKLLFKLKEINRKFENN